MLTDTKKFLELLKPHYNDALKYCRALGAKRSADEAKDVLQESLLKAMENLPNLRDESKFRSWFFKIITREYYSSIRKHFWKKFLPLDNYLQVSDFPDIYAHDQFEQNELKITLGKALSKLSAKERTALLLFEIAEFSIEEIKELQNEKSLSAVKSRLSRSRAKLRNYIDNLESKNHKIFLVRTDTPEGDLTDETIRLVSETERNR
jgi:RNA polymerase sigma-70 factor (ECF subfamily)